MIIYLEKVHNLENLKMHSIYNVLEKNKVVLKRRWFYLYLLLESITKFQ